MEICKMKIPKLVFWNKSLFLKLDLGNIKGQEIQFLFNLDIAYFAKYKLIL